MRVGQGFDSHPYEINPERPLVLGGVIFDSDHALVGHSDSDVIAHACTDALLGAAGLGDIGGWFPDDDAAFAGADSISLFRTVVAAVRDEGYGVVNIDCSVVAEVPKLAPRRNEIQQILSAAAGRSGHGQGQAARGPGAHRRGCLLGSCATRRLGEIMSARGGGPGRGKGSRPGGNKGKQPRPDGPPRSGRGSAKRSRRGGGAAGRTHRDTQARGDQTSRPKGPGGDVVEGRHAVRELLIAGNRRVREITFAADMDPAPILDEIVALADESRVPIRELGRSKFEALAVTDAPQGVIARAAPIQELELLDLLDTDTPPFLLVVDGITDPGNFGAILRTGECAGVTGIVMPRHRAARITPTVTKSAQGAVEYLPIATVSGIPKALTQLAEAGVWSVGLDATADTEVYDIAVADGPVALVLGAEGKGLARLTRERCDLVANIPLQGALGSLNVSAAAAIACFEVARKRRS